MEFTFEKLSSEDLKGVSSFTIKPYDNKYVVDKSLKSALKSFGWSVDRVYTQSGDKPVYKKGSVSFGQDFIAVLENGQIFRFTNSEWCSMYKVGK